MDIEEIRGYCLSLPLTSEDMPFGDDYLTLRVGGRIFACIGLARPDYFVLKCDPERAIELREHYPEIEPAWHWNKRHWNQHSLRGALPETLVKELIRHSYSLAAAKLPKRVRDAHPELFLFKE